jgi:IS30 family transposase
VADIESGNLSKPQTDYRVNGKKTELFSTDHLSLGAGSKQLRQRFSPEQIAGIFPLMFPEYSSMRASHETIYTALYAMPRGELRTELLPTLRHGG